VQELEETKGETGRDGKKKNRDEKEVVTFVIICVMGV